MMQQACGLYGQEHGYTKLIFVSCQNLDYVGGDDPEIPGADITADLDLMERQQDKRATAGDGVDCSDETPAG